MILRIGKLISIASFSISLVLSITISSFAQEKISLKWKVPDSKLFYRTDLGQQNPGEDFMEFDFDEIYKEDGITDEIKKKISNLKFPDNMNMITIIEKSKDGNFKTTSYFQNWEFPTIESESTEKESQDLKKFTELMNTAPQLEGEIDPNGKVESFFLQQKQKNLIALMHELPSFPVKIGDTWDINMYCIEMGSGFSADNAKRHNHIELKDIKKDDNGDKIATIEYVLTEKVSGKMLNPMSMEKSPIEMSCSYLGKHQFYVDKGYWKSINGEMSILSTGAIKAKMKQRIAMEPIEKLPDQIKHK